MIDTVIFDMDGTLFDTERVYEAGWLDAGVSVELYHRFIGRSRSDINALMLEAGLDPEATWAHKDAYQWKVFDEKGIPVKKGAEKALEYIRAHGMATAIATSSMPEVAQEYLDRTGFAPYFDAVISGQYVPNGKPAPDIFLFAAEKLGSSPERCLVVEDAPNGVHAGKAAGMTVAMIPDVVEPDAETCSLVDRMMESLEEIPAFLRELNRI